MKASALILAIGLIVSNSVHAKDIDGEFSSLKSCLNWLKGEIGQSMEIVIDKPNKVTGVYSGGSKFWACLLRQTGTKGIYWEGYYQE